ncbi:hypothetical protein ACSBR2_039706 [Camellia fascicularis]
MRKETERNSVHHNFLTSKLPDPRENPSRPFSQGASTFFNSARFSRKIQFLVRTED